tara:strand:+ start:417 stop:1058 length:642 start_codon:yes stop_codon:yes gene_type:complete
MKKYSVIIPTMWRSHYIHKILPLLLEQKEVEEIIIINNLKEEYKGQYEGFSKIKFITPDNNLYVNPSWNLGVKKATQENIILCSDDIFFDPKIYFYLLEQIDITDVGFIGMSRENFDIKSPSSPSLISYQPSTWGWGTLIAFNKLNWVPIPEVLKVWCGDSFMIEVNKAPTHTLQGIPVETQMSTTVDRKEFSQVKENDLKNWINVLNTFRNA